MQKTNKRENKQGEAFASNSIISLSIILTLIIVLTLSAYTAIADPDGATLTFVNNSTKASTVPDNRQDIGGSITTINITSQQQNSRWKAYVGNVTGSLSLDDADSYTIYDWALTTITGEIYAVRSASVNWQNIACASLLNITSEDSNLGFVTGAADTINNTFDNTAHQSFLVAGTNITASGCRSVATFVSDVAQVQDISANYQEILLHDRTNLIYTSLLENNAVGYTGGIFDFQLIVADNASTQNTNYYFFVELG